MGLCLFICSFFHVIIGVFPVYCIPDIVLIELPVLFKPSKQTSERGTVIHILQNETTSIDIKLARA